MPALASIPYPDANTVLMALLGDLAPTVIAVPNNFEPPLIFVRRIGGQPDADDVTDYPVVSVSVYGADYPSAQALMASVQVRILSAPLTEVNGVLIDSSGIHVGEQEVPDVYPDDRRITATYQLGWRRQF